MFNEWSEYAGGWIRDYEGGKKRAIHIQPHRKSAAGPVEGVPFKELWSCTYIVPRLGAFQETVQGDVESVKLKCEERLDKLTQQRFEKESEEAE